MHCALSGTETHDAVVSPRSGGVFDRKLAIAYVTTSGKDPLNDEPLAAEELISIASPSENAVVPPKPATFHSIPTMLAAFQNEWDALALETFTLRKQLAATREELSLALYKYDAAVRVAARATRDMEEAQRALQQVSEAFAQNGGKADTVDENVDFSETGKSVDFSQDADVLSRARDSLFALHKSLKLALSVTVKSGVSVTKTIEDSPVPSPTGLVFDSATKQKIFTGEFGSFRTFILPEGSKFEKKFTAAAYMHKDGRREAVGACDGHAVSLSAGQKMRFNLANVTQILAHPSEPYYVGYARDGKWVVCHVQRGVICSANIQRPITAADIHVDGALLGLATAGKVDIVDITSQKIVSSVSTDDMSSISCIKFALNGYWLVVAGRTDTSTGHVRIYDLRKGTLVHSFSGGESSSESAEADVEFALDPSCQILVTCYPKSQKLNVHLYAKKGKRWIENVHEENCGSLHCLQIESSVEDLQSGKEAHFTGISGNNLVHYQVVLKQ